MEERGGCKVFENRFGEQLATELAVARSLGVKAVHADDAAFFAVANGGRVNWVVTERGELLFVPQWTEGEAIAHTVMTQGGPVVAAGDALIAVYGDEAICTQITERSGQYQPDERSLEIGVQAFKTFGITFLSEPEVYRERSRELEEESYEKGEEDLLEVMKRFGLDGGSRETADQEGFYEVEQHNGDGHDGGRGDGKEGPIKWVVLESSQLLTDPNLMGNTVLSASEAMIAAGDYIDVVDQNERFCIEVTTDSVPSHGAMVQEPEARESTDGHDGAQDDDNSVYHDCYDEPSGNVNQEIDDGDRDREKGIFAKLQEEVMEMWQMLASRKRAGDEGTLGGSGVQVEDVQGDSQAQLPEGGNCAGHDGGRGDGNSGGDGGNYVVHDEYHSDSDEDAAPTDLSAVRAAYPALDDKLLLIEEKLNAEGHTDTFQIIESVSQEERIVGFDEWVAQSANREAVRMLDTVMELAEAQRQLQKCIDDPKVDDSSVKVYIGQDIDKGFHGGVPFDIVVKKDGEILRQIEVQVPDCGKQQSEHMLLTNAIVHAADKIPKSVRTNREHLPPGELEATVAVPWPLESSIQEGGVIKEYDTHGNYVLRSVTDQNVIYRDGNLLEEVVDLLNKSKWYNKPVPVEFIERLTVIDRHGQALFELTNKEKPGKLPTQWEWRDLQGQ